MQDTVFNEVFTESYINDVNDGFEHLSKVFIESCAAVAYNDVVFEAALSDEVLAEGEKFDNFKKGAGNAAFNAVETIKRVAANIFNKIRVAINEFIKNNNEKKVAAKFKEYADKIKEYDVPLKTRDLSLDVEKVFPVVIDFNAYTAMKDEKKIAAELGKKVASGLPDNYHSAKEALGKAETISDVAKVVGNMVSYADDVARTVQVKVFVNNNQAQKVPAWTKKMYTNSVSKSNDFIKAKQKSLKADMSQEEIDGIKDEVRIAQKLLSLLHSSYVGALKWSVAYNKEALDALKTAPKQEAFTEFLGLQLL